MLERKHAATTTEVHQPIAVYNLAGAGGLWSFRQRLFLAGCPHETRTGGRQGSPAGNPGHCATAPGAAERGWCDSRGRREVRCQCGSFGIRSGARADLRLGCRQRPLRFRLELDAAGDHAQDRQGNSSLRAGAELDVFILASAEDLVPVLVALDGDRLQHHQSRTAFGQIYTARRYRARVEGLFARIERWRNDAEATDNCWRSISRDNITTWYGRTAESRIVDPGNPRHVFSWLICETYDDKGNVVSYAYKPEDAQGVDAYHLSCFGPLKELGKRQCAGSASQEKAEAAFEPGKGTAIGFADTPMVGVGLLTGFFSVAVGLQRASSCPA